VPRSSFKHYIAFLDEHTATRAEARVFPFLLPLALLK
jgi:hypothetical protein